MEAYRGSIEILFFAGKCWRTSCIGGSFAAFFGAAPSICEECDSTFDGSTACAYGRCLSQHTCFHFGPSGHGWSFSGNEDARHVSLLLFVSPLCIFATALVTNRAASRKRVLPFRRRWRKALPCRQRTSFLHTSARSPAPATGPPPAAARTAKPCSAG